MVNGAPVPTPLDFYQAALEGRPGFRTIQAAPQRAVRLFALRRDDLGPQFVVVSGQPLQVVQQNVNGLRFFITLVTLLTLAGAFAAMIFLMARGMKPDPGMMCNGMLAGLVAITAPCAFVPTPSTTTLTALAATS